MCVNVTISTQATASFITYEIAVLYSKIQNFFFIKKQMFNQSKYLPKTIYVGTLVV